MKITQQLFWVLIFFISLISCQPRKEDSTPPTPAKADTLNINTPESLYNKLYKAHLILKYDDLYKRGLMLFTELASDDCAYTENSNSLDNLSWEASNSVLFGSIFKNLYEGVYVCNSLLENTSKIAISAEEKNRVLGEAYFLRGYYYWHLVTLYANVPVFTSTSQNFTNLTEETFAQTKVYEQCIVDFNKASELLTETGKTDEYNRVTKYAAIAMLGKTYLYMQEWQKSSEQFRKVISSGKYKLLDDFRNVFSPNNKFNDETVFEINFKNKGLIFNSFTTVFGSSNSNETNGRDKSMGIIGGAGQRGFSEIIANRDLVYEFEFNDPRMKETVWFVRNDREEPYDSSLIGYKSDGSLYSNIKYTPSMNLLTKYGYSFYVGEYYHIKKGVYGYYSNSNDPSYSDNSYRAIRYSDILLMAAEAIAEANGGPTDESVGYLNQVRARARKMVPSEIKLATVPGGYFNLTKSERMLPNEQALQAYSYVPNTVLPNYPSTPATKIVHWNLQSLFKLSLDEFEEIGYNLTDFRKAIVHERRVELATEYHRWYDLVRWDRISGHPGAAKTVFLNKIFGVNDVKNFTSKHRLLPIPESIILLTGYKLKQNPDY